MPATILIVDDEVDILSGVSDHLKSLGYATVTAGTGEEALCVFQKHQPDVVLLDLELPHKSGLEVLGEMGKIQIANEKNHQDNPRHVSPCQLSVIVLTAHGSLENAVEAMKLGAYDFLTKPFEMDHLIMVIEKALERESLVRKVKLLSEEVDSPYATIVGHSDNIRDVIDVAQKAADSNATILLMGETGTGKELFARRIHSWSPRHGEPFAIVNCAALPENLLENELFGHEKGAFTGADRFHRGRIESANGGTVFLDEIGEMPIKLQSRLLRVLQDHEIQRVGGSGNVAVNARFIAATNCHLKAAVKDGTFREDLYYRLNVVSITLPSLKERREDLIELAEFFLARNVRDTKRAKVALAPDAIEAILQYPWPGNVRELDNVLARAVILNTGTEITAEQLRLETTCLEPGPIGQQENPQVFYKEAMEHYSASLILNALHRNKGNKTKAAEELGLQRTHLNTIMKRKSLQWNDSEVED